MVRETNTLPEALRATLDASASEPRTTAAQRLGPFLRDVRAGVPDDLIAKSAGVPVRAVRRWRRQHGIQAGIQDTVALAADVFGTGSRDTMHRSASSPIGGRFEVPEYVLRVPLQYEALARHLHALHDVLGSSAAELAAAFGIRDQDVETCLVLWQAHLERSGVPCCGALRDPRFRCPRCGS